MTQQQETSAPGSPVALWAAYQRQVAATQTAWRTYEDLARQADAALTAYRIDAARRDELYDAYRAAHEPAA